MEDTLVAVIRINSALTLRFTLEPDAVTSVVQVEEVHGAEMAGGFYGEEPPEFVATGKKQTVCVKLCPEDFDSLQKQFGGEVDVLARELWDEAEGEETFLASHKKKTRRTKKKKFAKRKRSVVARESPDDFDDDLTFPEDWRER